MNRMRPSLLLLMVMSPGMAAACQYCAVTLTYIAFRFSVAWALLLVVWSMAAVAADWQERGRRERGWGQLYSAGWLKFVFFATVMALMLGLGLFVMVFFPMLLLPYVWPWWRRWRKRPHPAEQAPQWLRRAAAGLLVAAAVLALPSYWIFPMLQNEVNARSMVSRCRSDMRLIAQALEDYRAAHGAFPPPVAASERGVPISALPLGAFLAERKSELTRAAQDRFAYRPTSAPISTIIMYFPVSLYMAKYILKPRPNDFYMGDAFIRSDPEIHSHFQYILHDEGFALWGRGTDTVFENEAGAILRDSEAWTRIQNERRADQSVARPAYASPLTDTSADLVPFTYDPTNGIFSRGDVFFLSRIMEQ